MAKKIFKEKNRFDDAIVLLPLVAAVLTLLYGALTYLWDPVTTPTYALVSLLLASLLTGTVVWLSRLQLQLKVSDKSIKVKLDGAPVSNRKISWKDVKACKIVEPSDLDYWLGRRLYLDGYNEYSLTGRGGLFVQTKQGEEYFIGCRNIDEIRVAFNRFFINDGGGFPTEAEHRRSGL